MLNTHAHTDANHKQTPRTHTVVACIRTSLSHKTARSHNANVDPRRRTTKAHRGVPKQHSAWAPLPPLQGEEAGSAIGAHVAGRPRNGRARGGSGSDARVGAGRRVVAGGSRTGGRAAKAPTADNRLEYGRRPGLRLCGAQLPPILSPRRGRDPLRCDQRAQSEF